MNNTQKKIMHCFAVVFAVTILLSISAFSVVAEDDQPVLYTTELAPSLCGDLMNLAQVGNSLPGFIPYKNDVFNVYDLEGTPVGHITLVQGEITAVDCTVVEEPTNNVFVKNGAVIDDIKASENSAKTYQEMKRDGFISIKGVHFKNKVKTGFVNIGLFFASLF